MSSAQSKTKDSLPKMETLLKYASEDTGKSRKSGKADLDSDSDEDGEGVGSRQRLGRGWGGSRNGFLDLDGDSDEDGIGTDLMTVKAR